MSIISYPQMTFLSEQIAENIKLEIPKPEVIVKTTEYAPTTSHQVNFHLNNANQWYEIKLPRDAITWQLKARGDHDLLYSFSPTHQNYTTLTSGNVLSTDTSPNKEINAVYVMCETARVIVELDIWRK